MHQYFGEVCCLHLQNRLRKVLPLRENKANKPLYVCISIRLYIVVSHTITEVLNHGSAERRSRFREKSWNNRIPIIRLCEEFQIFCKILWDFLRGDWQCWSNLRAVPAACLFCFDSFVFEVIFSCILCLCLFRTVRDA